MSDAATTICPNCKWLEGRLIALEARVRELEARNASLESEIARLRKDSSNSHKPPSSDVVKPESKSSGGSRGKKRKIGGQPGHKRNERRPFPAEEIDQTHEHRLDHCPDCGRPLEESSEPPRVLQQVELVEKPIVVTEHRAPAYWCAHCGKFHYAQMPAEVKAAGLVGPLLTALVAWLKGAAHCSYTTIQAFVRDVLGIDLSRGQLARLVRKAGSALSGAYGELLGALPSEARLNVDETGHKESGKNLWTWCFRAGEYTVFKIDPSRGSGVLLDALGEDFEGILGCDYFSAYRKYMGEMNGQVQFCLAHLIRDVKFLTTLEARTRKYGERLLEGLRKLFGVIHRRDRMGPDAFRRALERERGAIMHVATHPPWTREARNLAERFRRHGEAYFRFVTTPGVEPTNNLAEQALRFVVIDRRITQGTRGEAGRTWCERIWTARATCAQQGRSVFEFLHSAVTASFTNKPPPSLLAA